MANSERPRGIVRRSPSLFALLSVLERIEHVGAGHHHGERPQGVLDPDRTGVMGEHVGQASIGLRRLVEITTDQSHAFVTQPRLHLVVAHAPGLPQPLAGRGILDEAAARLGARHHAAGAVHRRVEASCRSIALDTGQDDGVVSHGAADEAALPRERRRGALAHDPEIAIAVALAPCIVVVVVHGVEHLASDDRAHALHHPLAPSIGIETGERHAGEILPSEIAVLVQYGGRHVDAVGSAGRLDEGGRSLMAEPARAEVNADPHEAVLVLEQIDVVIAGPDGAELVARHRLEMTHEPGFLP